MRASWPSVPLGASFAKIVPQMFLRLQPPCASVNSIEQGWTMTARVATVAFQGIEAVPVDVQAQFVAGQVQFHVVGLPDKAVAESRERVRAALHSIGLALPGKRIVVNLSPADLPKEGSHFDLPIALALLSALGIIPPGFLMRYSVIGELALDGSILAVAGALPAAMAANARDLYQPADYLTHGGSQISDEVIQQGKRRDVCHGPSDCGANGLFECGTSGACQTAEECRSGPQTSGARSGARRRFAGSGGQDWRHGPSDAQGLGDRFCHVNGERVLARWRRQPFWDHCR